MSLNNEDARRNSQAYRLYAASKDPKATPSRTYVNSAMLGTYRGITWQTVRAGADDYQLIASGGLGPQVTRA